MDVKTKVINYIEKQGFIIIDYFDRLYLFHKDEKMYRKMFLFFGKYIEIPNLLGEITQIHIDNCQVVLKLNQGPHNNKILKSLGKKINKNTDVIVFYEDNCYQANKTFNIKTRQIEEPDNWDPEF